MSQHLLKSSTVKVAELLQRVVMELSNLRRGVITAEFVLMGLVEQKDSIVLKIFDELRLASAELRRKIVDVAMEQASTLPSLEFEQAGSMQVTQDVQNLFTAADRERHSCGDAYISTGAVFLACFDPSVPSTARLLQEMGLEQEACRKAWLEIRGLSKITQKDDESRRALLDQYTTDITALARKGTLDPVLKREREITRVIEILSRRKKNNPVLIGEPGVGKTVIVEGLAQQIASGDVPEHLLSKRILLLEIGTLIAGAKVQGEFEERLNNLKDEVIAAAGEVILFIDELHTVVGAGRTGGGLDASNMLKPALAKGLLQCLGATTSKEYKQYIESDKALERRFQPVRIAEPSVAQTLAILHGLRSRYEAHHQITYEDEALQGAAELSQRYLPDRFLPDKAIDLIDEAGAAKRLKIVYNPPELRKMEKERNDLLAKKAEAFNDSDFELMSRYQTKISRLEAKISKEREKFNKERKKRDTQVNKEDIARIVHRMTGIPVARMVAEEIARLKALEERFRQRVIGQEHAITAVANAIRRNRAGLRRVEAPIASFLFLGPTGVGKTELAKAIAAEMMDNEANIIRLDMSEYSERHEVAKLIGSPPGYVGYGEGGQLTERIRHQPYAVVLFDEIEKAHPDLLSIMLQILDEGWLTDAEGTKVSFQNAIVVGTSNLGSAIMTEQKRPVGIGAQSFSRDDELREIMAEVKRFLKPEFINRLDEIIIFNRLRNEDLRQVLDLQIKDLAKRLATKDITLSLANAVQDHIISAVDTRNYGARPLQRKLQQLVENKIAVLLMDENTTAKRQIDVALDGKEITVRFVQASSAQARK